MSPARPARLSPGSLGGSRGLRPLPLELRRSEGSSVRSQSVVAGFGNLPCEVLWSEPYCVCWCRPHHDWEKGTGGKGTGRGAGVSLQKTPPAPWEDKRARGRQPCLLSA